MTDERRQELLETCRQTSILLDEIQADLVPWAVKAGKINSLFLTALGKIKEKVQKFPKGWSDLTLAQIAVGSVLRDPARIQDYLSGPGHFHSTQAVRFLESLQDRPSFFTAFSAENAFGDDLFEIRDHSSNEVHLLLSSALGQIARRGMESFLTLLFSNGLCLQAIGPIHYYQALAPGDFHYYAGLLQPQLYQESGLSAVMTAVPESFVILDAFSEIPAIAHKGKRLFCCWSALKTASLDASALASSFLEEEAKGRKRFRLRGSDPPLATADLYWDPGTREAFIYTKTKEDYDRVCQASKGQLEAPADPQVAVTQNMEVIAKALLGIDPPVIAWENSFEGSAPHDPAGEAEIEHLNALLRDLVDATNHGKAYDLQKLAAHHGVSLENARQAEEVLKRQERSMAIDLPGGLPGVPPVPPSGRMKMTANLATCPLFRFSTDDHAQRLFEEVAARVQSLRPPSRSQMSRTRTMLTLATLPSVLEEIDDPPRDDREHTVLKYSMYLLCQAGAEYHGTEDYAAEILRLFWQVLLESKERAELRRFVRQYSIWCQEVLVRAGLAEAELAPEKAGAPFRMRATAFFKAWVRIGKTW